METTDHDARRRRAHELVDRLVDRLLAHDMAGFAELWAPDGTADFPFAPPGWPRPRGREEVRAYVAGYNELVLPREIVHQTRHETGDPDTLVLEWGVAGTVTATGEPYRLDYVVVITCGAEGVVSYRDYWSPSAVERALGGPVEPAAFGGAAQGSAA
ncbi:nuclear transport factor 2 family protein [Streptomyces sp. TRM 70361]|uniref:nuclear transport factor 2 family protein n=1 Tax=Streptomyces sp. TRM 70361 TaxID=3116553 RepID=UPI002E7AC08A|nr:nuclear transport factor 2 family protein [Streptomyces sp. TRM 70361]MEE1938996.1 nuclear transport factor 2 family protein [Streptomyces sp. TRM 70361]